MIILFHIPVFGAQTSSCSLESSFHLVAVLSGNKGSFISSFEGLMIFACLTIFVDMACF